ncbi:MAG TPA: thiamine phosphate synthase [Gemmatimonadota bacterium]|nr:thiamine phosphate synthase [Gemmatimonadota bacterium]
MSIDRSRPLLCFVHSATDLDSALRLIERGVGVWGAVDLVQVRGKILSAGDLEALVDRWLEGCEPGATRIVVNDRLDVAIATGAHGVHVGHDDLPPAEIRARAPQLILGMSAHNPAELLAAQTSGADYAGLGAFYGSRTKPEAVVLDPRGAGLLEPSPGLRIPVLAIGGITAERVPDVLSIPVVSGIAVSEAIQGADDPAAAVNRLRSSLDAAWARRAEPTPRQSDGPARRAG